MQKDKIVIELNGLTGEEVDAIFMATSEVTHQMCKLIDRRTGWSVFCNPDALFETINERKIRDEKFLAER